MLTKSIGKKIQETLNAKKRVLERKVNPSITENPSASSYRTIKDIASRSIFVRMISNKSNVENNFPNASS